MGHLRRTMNAVALTAGLAIAPALAQAETPHAAPPRAAAKAPQTLVQVESPPFSEGIYPCSSCHADMEKNGTRRELAFHDEQQSIFDHDAEHRWCLDCHDLQNRDVLRLASGAPVPFTESYRLCGQCHGDKYRDWRAGVHGKRVGQLGRREDLFPVRELPQPPLAPLQGGAGGRGGREEDHRAHARPTLKPEPRPQRPEEHAPMTSRRTPPGAGRHAEPRAAHDPRRRTPRSIRRAAPSCARPPPAPPSPALSACGVEMEDFLRKHFKELSPDELKRVLAKVERRNEQRFGEEDDRRRRGAAPGRRVRLRPRPLALRRAAAAASTPA